MKTLQELYEDNRKFYGDDLQYWPEKARKHFEKTLLESLPKNKSATIPWNPWPSVDKLNADWAARIEAAGPVEDEQEDPRADPESDVFDPLAVVKGEVKPKRKPSKSKPNKKGE